MRRVNNNPNQSPDNKKKSKNFQEKFKDKISVTNKDGTRTKLSNGEVEKQFKPTIIQKTSPSKPPNPFNSQQKSQEVPTPFKPLYKIPNSPIQIAPNNNKETNILIVNHTNHDRYDSVPSTACVSELSVSPEANNQPVAHHVISNTSSRFSSRESTASSRNRKKPPITAQQFKNMVEEKKKDNEILVPKIESPPSPQQPKVIGIPQDKKINVRLIHENENQENESFISSIDHVSPINKAKNAGAYSDIYGMPKKKNDFEDVDSIQKEQGYSKSKKEISYKPYSINDYNKIKSQSNIKLGGLGADLQNEQLLEKKEKASKMKEYAKEITQINNTRIKKQKTPNQPTPQEIEAAKQASVREKALDFASKIPKPKPKKKYSGSATADAEPEPLSELEMLELQHERDREWLKKEFATR